MKGIFINFLFVLIAYSPLFGQDYVYKHYTRENGLAGNMVYCSSQDKDGFIWFGTENGASRFDGKNFVNFTTEDGLTDNEVLEVYSDKKGRTWFVCFTGGLCYYYKGKIYSHKNDQQIPQDLILSKMAFGGFYEDRFGTVWFLSETAWGYNDDQKLIPKIPELMGMDKKKYQMDLLKDTEINDIVFLVSSRYANQGKLYKFDGKKVSARNIYNLRILNSKTGTFSVSRRFSPKGLKIVHLKGNKCFIYKIVNDSILLDFEKAFDFDITRISYNSIENRHFLCTYNSGAVEVSNNFDVIEQELSDQKISSVLLDSYKNKWFTTLGNGIFFKSKSAIKVYDKAHGLAFQNINSLNILNKKKLYLGFQDGYIQQFSNTTFTTLQKISNYELSFNNVRKVFTNNRGEIFYGTDRSFAKQTKGGKLFFYNASGSLKDFSLVNDSVLIYTSHAGALLSYPDNRIDTLLYRKRSTNIVSTNKQGFNHFIATTDTLYFLDDNKKLNHVEKFNHLKYGRISDMKFSKSNVLFLSTYNNGLVCLKDDSLFQINESNGLISNQVRKLYLENDTKVWALTSMGVSKITISFGSNEIKCTNYTQADGFSSDLFSGIAKIGDTIYLATDKGLNCFHENQLPVIPDHTVQITSFEVNNVSKELATSKILIHYGDNVKIKFSGISFSSSDKLTYKYLLSGLDPAGIYTSINELELPRLMPGNYSFKVYAINKNNVESQNATVIYFEITPLWWQTLWFKLAVALAISFLLYRLFKFRIRKIKVQEVEKTKINKQFAELKLEAVRSQMDPHFIFNCLNAIQHFNIKEDYKSAQYFMAEFAKLIRKTLNHSHRDFVLLADEIELLEIYIKLEILRFEDLITYNIKIADEVNKHLNEIKVPSLIFQPYIENAINHGLKYLKTGTGKLYLHFSIQNKRLLVTLDDNGIGIIESQKLKQITDKERTSYGISLNDTHINVINKIHDLDIAYTIKDKSTFTPAQQGTVVEISLPVKLKN